MPMVALRNDLVVVYRVSAGCDQASVEKDRELLEPAGGERSCPQWCGDLLKQGQSFYFVI